MRGARGVLINITGGPDMTLFEVDEAANRIKEEVDPDANIIVGSTLDESMDGEMRVSVVATGIEARGELRSEPATPVVAEVKPAVSAPSFRLRPQMPKPASASLFPIRQTPVGDERKEPALSAPAAPAAAVAGGSAASATVGPGTPTAPGETPAADAAAQASEPAKAGERAFPHPPLPPQERFQEWGRLRAPVRELERAPSLFERVTASFARPRPERAGEPTAAPGGGDAGEQRMALAEEEHSYDIPAFLRR